MTIASFIRSIPDYPKKGIIFRDITTLFKDKKGFVITIDKMYEHYKDMKIDKVAAIEARGFILGAALAYKLGVGFVPVRKKGKLPAETVSQEYTLEYGSDTLEIHVDDISSGEKILLVDDLIATGGTAIAAASLIESMNAEIVECAFIIDLPDLGGADKLREKGYKVFSLCAFEGE